MAVFHLRSAVEQVADHLRSELAAGKWTGTMPGVYKLGEELDVSRETLEAALRALEIEGILVSQGAGKRRMIVLPKDFAPPALRVQILLYEKSDQTRHFMVDLVHRLQARGHSAGFSPKTLEDLQMDVSRVSKYVSSQGADAWIIFAGSQEVLQWFVEQPVPVFALYGRQMSVAIAGTGHRKAPSVSMAISRLVELGHRRISFLVREDRRKPTPGVVESLFLEELESHGIQTGPYNLPEWESRPADFHRCLDSLFLKTPPTALLISEPQLFFAAQLHLSRRGIIAPDHVSLICTDPDPAFHWSEPSVAHIGWEPGPLLRYMQRWVDHIACGKADQRKRFFKSEFIEGGTVGPVAGNRQPRPSVP